MLLNIARFSIAAPVTNHHPYLSNPRFYDLYGYMFLYAPLSEMVPDDSVDPVKILAKRDYDGARKGLEEAVKRHPDSLSLFVALAQDSPDAWDAQIKEFERKPIYKLTPDEKFKYATLLFYYWGAWTSNYDKKLDLSQNLLTELWQKDRRPEIALMLCTEYFVCLGEGSRFRNQSAGTILDDLTKTLISEETFKQYKIAEKNGWNNDPPDISKISPKNKKELNLVIKCRLGMSRMKFSTTKIINGKVVNEGFAAYRSGQLAEQKYFKTWSENLLASKSTQ
jgi:hypothetical protein